MGIIDVLKLCMRKYLQVIHLVEVFYTREVDMCVYLFILTYFFTERSALSSSTRM